MGGGRRGVGFTCGGWIGLYRDLRCQHRSNAGQARRTKDLASYSLGNIALANLGNLIYAVYVFSLPLGPVWALHGFHLGASALMLFWYLRHARSRRPLGDADEIRRGRTTRDSASQTGRSLNSLASAGKSAASVFHTIR
jgi:hypothetical protein